MTNLILKANLAPKIKKRMINWPNSIYKLSCF